MPIAHTLIAAAALGAAAIDTAALDKNAPNAGFHASYSGTLRPSDPGDQGSERSFRIHFLVTESIAGGASSVAWVLEDRSGNPRAAWPQRFGTVTFNRSLQPSNDRELPSIPAERDGMTRAIGLRLPLWSSGDRLMPDARWEEGENRFEVMGRESVGGRRSWKVGIANRLGPREVVWIDEQEGFVTRHRELVFLGQGVSHELSLELEKSSQLPGDELSRTAKAHTTLVNIRGQVKDKLSELADSAVPATNERLQQARSAAGDIEMALGSGAYVQLAKDVVRELQSAISSQESLAKLSTQFVGKPAPAFSLKTARGDQVSLADFKGKPLVLHFWEYRSEPKIAPYGETGYLDFLWRQRQKQGIAVLGIAVDPRLRDETTRSAARRDVRSFCDFMNLSYPVAFDDGTKKVVEAFGDPRSAGGKLPLYVVIGPDGVIAEYHPGSWSKSADEGLKELDERLRKLLP
jgi:peroxiredoxin